MFDSDDSIFDLDKDKPLVLLLSLDHISITGLLKAYDRQYKIKRLNSTLKNWQSIIDFFDEFDVSSVLVKLTASTFSMMVNSEYEEISNVLFERISKRPHMIFIYEDLLSGEPQKFQTEWEHYSFPQPKKEDLVKALNILENLNLEVVPYKRNVQVNMLAESFLLETEGNLLFRLYMPTGRIWSNELDRLLQLFRDYLSNIGHHSLRLDQKRTDKGIVYEIHGEKSIEENGLRIDFSEFTQFLDLCVTNQNAAEAILTAKNIDKHEVFDILARYSKEAKRLFVDLKHDRERKILTIQQRLESELVEVITGEIDWQFVEELVEFTVPPLIGAGTPLRIGQLSDSNHRSNSQTNVTINLNPQIVGTVNGIVAQEIHGNQNLGVQGQQLLELVYKYGEERADELASAVYEIEDEDIPKPERLKAGQKIKKFLYGIGRLGGDVAAGVLQSYIENQLGF